MLLVVVVEVEEEVEVEGGWPEGPGTAAASWRIRSPTKLAFVGLISLFFSITLAASLSASRSGVRYLAS